MAQLDWYIRTNLKPRHLQLLVALDEHRNVGVVAASLHVSQPAVSKSLGELERGLGVKLFERTPRGIVPTVYGECLIRHARMVLADLNVARDELRGLVSGASGRTSVGALPAATPALLPEAIARLKATAPGTTVLLREGTMEGFLPELRTGKVDIIVGALPHLAGAPDLEHRILFEERIALVTGPAHPLAKKKRIAWTDLRDQPWVLPPVGSLFREPLEAAFERHRLAMPADSIETLSVHVLRAYLQLVPAIAILQSNVARYYARLGLLAILPLGLDTIARPIGVVWSRHRPMSPSTRALVECLQEVAGPMRDRPARAIEELAKRPLADEARPPPRAR